MELPPLEQLRESRTEMEELGLSLVPNPSPWLEIRLFYVRISPCCVDLAPEQLCLRTLPRPMGALLEINGVRIPPSDSAALSLRRDRLDRGAAEVTYVSTDGVRIAGELGLEVLDSKDDPILCGSLERVEAQWGEMETPRLEKDGRTGWSMDCYSAVASPRSASPFLRGAATTPSIEVYLAGCCSGFPLILTKTIPLASRKKVVRQGALESIPEDEETGVQQTGSIALLRRRALQVADERMDPYDPEDKISHSFYTGDVYSEDDGELTWFNAGVRVGVGIGLGMCLGIGIGVGLLMRSYQATTRSFKRKFF